MSEFKQWLKAAWETLEGRTGEKYSTRRLSIEAGLSPNTLYQLLKHPEVKPNPETCHKLASFFDVEPLLILEMAGHISAQGVSKVTDELEGALRRSDLRQLLLSAQHLSPTEVQLVQQVVDQLSIKHQETQAEDVARGAAVALVVEDTPDTRALYVDMLQAAGLKVLQAPDGESALELMKTSGTVIDMVLMDYRMPRMNGVEATQAIRRQFPDLPILFVSHWDEPEMKRAAFEAGAAKYLVAPVEYETLVEAVLQVRQRPKANVN